MSLKKGRFRFPASEDLMPWILVALLVLIIVPSLIRMACRTFIPNVFTGTSEKILYIRHGDSFEQVFSKLKEMSVLGDTTSFRWVAARKGYGKVIRPGKYLLKDGMSNNALINMLRSGRQQTVKVRVGNFRTRAELAGKIGMLLEADSSGIMTLLNDPGTMSVYGLTPVNSLGMFLPDTYDFYWSTTAKQFIERMFRVFLKFWNEARRREASNKGLTPVEATILASIVEKETNLKSEKPLIASVYLNRLKAGIPLQADPTVIYAWNDYSIRRVLTRHTQLPSPFNTYYIKGLPPGPICIPSKSSIDAVLQAPKSSYYYFCAKEDFSGSHVFASTLKEHSRNACKYQEAYSRLNQEK
jgi:UPF0755 protein